MKLYGIHKRVAVTLGQWLMLLLVVWVSVGNLHAEDVGSRWGTEEQERKYYRIVNIPIPEGKVIESGAFEVLPGNKLAIGTRRGDIYFVKGFDARKPQPTFHLYATGLDEIFGLAYHPKEKTLYATQSCELTRLKDTNNDGKADRFEITLHQLRHLRPEAIVLVGKRNGDGRFQARCCYVLLGFLHIL